MTHNLRGGVGPFNIFHIGGKSYTVERSGKVFGTFEIISEAYRVAGELQLAAQLAERADHDDDMFEESERDRQAERFDHARDLRKHGDA